MAQRVVVVALVEGHVAFACGVIEARARGEAALAAPEKTVRRRGSSVEPKPWVWPMRWQPGGGALARRGEGTFDSPSQSVPHAESPQA